MAERALRFSGRYRRMEVPLGVLVYLCKGDANLPVGTYRLPPDAEPVAAYTTGSRCNGTRSVCVVVRSAEFSEVGFDELADLPVEPVEFIEHG